MPATELPDPRLLRHCPHHPLLAALAFEAGGLSAASQQALQLAMQRMLEQDDDAALHALLSWPAKPDVSKAVRGCLQKAIETPDEAALRLQIFAIPLIVVAGSQSPTELPMVLPDVGRVREIFRVAGCLGPSEQFALSAGLCDAHALASLSPSAVYRLSRLSGATRHTVELPASPLLLAQAGQSVHLRFLLGSALVARGAPSFRETAGEVGRWGAAMTREVASQLARSGVTILPLGRAPQGIYVALSRGRFCREEMAFQLAVGDYLRAVRAREGDPRAQAFASHEGHLVVEFESPWEKQIVSHHWRLNAEDDFAEVVQSLFGFLRACRIEEVQILPRIAGAAALIS